MPEIPVYLIANLLVEDAKRYREYEKGFFPLLKRHGGELVTFDDATRLEFLTLVHGMAARD